MKSLLRLKLLLAAALFVPASYAADVSTKLGFESAYVSYGTKFSEETWIPMVDVSQGDYYAGVWGYLPSQPRKSFEGEWDFFAGRTFKASKLISFDVGATVYRYPRTDVDNTTLEGFLWLNVDTVLSPKVKLYYDVVVRNWIGEFQVQHTVTLSRNTALVLEGHAGFRRPEYHDAWYYVTAKADLAFTLDARTKAMVGVRSTDNTDRAAVGHSQVNWFGVTLARNW